jgi:hypothetical protein
MPTCAVPLQVLYEQFFDTEEELPIQLNHIVNAKYKACLAQVRPWGRRKVQTPSSSLLQQGRVSNALHVSGGTQQGVRSDAC